MRNISLLLSAVSPIPQEFTKFTEFTLLTELTELTGVCNLPSKQAQFFISWREAFGHRIHLPHLPAHLGTHRIQRHTGVQRNKLHLALSVAKVKERLVGDD